MGHVRLCVCVSLCHVFVSSAHGRLWQGLAAEAKDVYLDQSRQKEKKF